MKVPVCTGSFGYDCCLRFDNCEIPGRLMIESPVNGKYRIKLQPVAPDEGSQSCLV